MFGLNEKVGKEYFKNAGDRLFVTSIFYSLQGEGPLRGRPAIFVRLAKCNLGCSWCFHGNTLISMGDGSRKKISEIKEGDEVVSWNEELMKFEIKKVSYVHPPRAVSEIIRLRTGKGNNPNDLVYVTKEHPYLVKGKGWVKAGDLKPGDVLLHFTSSDRMILANPRHNEDYNENWKKSALTEENRQARSKRLKALWEDPEFREMKVEYALNSNPMKDPAVAARGYKTRNDRGHKSSIEKKFERIMFDQPIEFVGDGSLEIGYKFPDFIVKGQNKLIEVWAEDALFARGRDEEWRRKRAAIFAKHGYETLFVPMTLGKMDEEALRKQVSEFIHNGDVVTSVEVITKPELFSGSDGKAWIRLAGGKEDLLVYNFETEDNHTYVANGKIVHNCDAFFEDGDWLTVDEVIEKCREEIIKYFDGEVPAWAAGYGGDHSKYDKRQIAFVVTGGEPTLQPNLFNLLQAAEREYKWTQIESNGILEPIVPDSTIVVVSPKCMERVDVSEGFKRYIPTGYLTPNPKTLARANALKFIMEDQPDFDSPYQTVPEWAHKWHEETGRDVFVSPMNIYNREPKKAQEIRAQKLADGSNRVSLEERSMYDEVVSFWEPGLFNMEANQRNHEWACDYAIRHGFIFQMQLHLFGSKA